MRYHRQELVLGQEAQKKLEASCVVIIGVGALGTVASELLCRAGVNLVLIDRDVVEDTNLQRQTLFYEEDVGKSKAVIAKERLSKINSSINIETHAIHVNKDNINVLEKADLIIDCTDNLSTRFLLNDYCRKNNKIWIYGAAIRTSGYVMPIFPDGPCLQCFIEEASLDTCDTVGVLNAITTSIGALQVSVGMKVLLRKYEARNDLYYYDIWNPTLKKLKVTKKENCPTCNGNYEYLTKDDSMIPIKFCGKGKYQIQGKKKEFGEMKAKWSSLGEVIDDGETLRFKNMLLFKDGRVLITADTEEDARSMYSKYVGD